MKNLTNVARNAKLLALTLALTAAGLAQNSALAAYDNTAGATGAQMRYSAPTGDGFSINQRTGKNAVALPRTSTAGLGYVPGSHAGLPPTRLDSFVEQAGGLADRIYGGEGKNGPDPTLAGGFTPERRINAGIQGNSQTLTTGHGSWLPSAWGNPEEMSMSGTGGDGGVLPGGAVGGGYFDPTMMFPGADGGPGIGVGIGQPPGFSPPAAPPLPMPGFGGGGPGF